MVNFSGVKIFSSLVLALLLSVSVFANDSKQDWENYSNGLYYQSQALKAKTRDERVRLLEKSIDEFLEAEKSGTSLEEVYFQVSQCYYLMGNSEKSRLYAEKSLEAKSDYFPAYNRIFELYVASGKNKEAAAILEKYITIKPDDPYPVYTLALHYYREMKNFDKALDKLERIEVLSRKEIVPLPVMKKAYYLKGLVYLNRRDYRSAGTGFKKAYDLDSSDLNTLYMLAGTYMSYYNLDEAEKYAVLFLKSRPDNLSMNFIMGRIKYLKGDEGAIEAFAKLKRARNFESVTALALYYELTGDDVKAEKLLNAIMKYKTPILSVSVALSRIKMRQDNKEEAYKALVSAGTASFRDGLYSLAEKLFYQALSVKTDDNYSIYYYLARTHEENRRYLLAISFYKNYYRMSKENNILTHIGYLYGIIKDYKTAHIYFDRARAMDPENPSQYFFRGLVQVWSGEYNKANENFRKAIKLKDDEESYYFYQAVAYEKLNKINESISSLKMALKQNPRSARANNYLGYLYLERGIKLNEAFIYIETALKYEPENGAYLDSMGWFYYKTNKYEDALRYLLIAEEKLRLSDSMDAVVYDHIGDTYLKLGNTKMAMIYWKKSYEMSKDKSVMMKINRN